MSKKQTLEALVRLIGRVPKASPVFRTCRNRCLECQLTCSCTGCSSVHSQSRVRASRSAPGPSAHMVARCECAAIRRSPPGSPGVESRNPGMTPGPLGTCWMTMAWSLATRVRRPAMASVDRSARAALAVSWTTVCTLKRRGRGLEVCPQNNWVSGSRVW